MWSRTSHVALRIVAAIPQYPELRLKVMKSPPPLQDPPIIQQRRSITRVRWYNLYTTGALVPAQNGGIDRHARPAVSTSGLPGLPPTGCRTFLEEAVSLTAHTHTHTLWHSGTGLHSHIEQWVGLHFDRYDEGTPGLRSPDHAGHQPLQGTHT